MKLRGILATTQFAVIAVAFALLSAGIPAGGAWGGWMPDLTPVPLFYFLVHRPERAPMVAVFAVGLLADLLYGRVPGTGALALLAAGEAVRFALAGALAATALGRATLLLAFCAVHGALLAAAYLPTGDVWLHVLGRQALWTAASYLPFALLLRHVFRIRVARKRELVQ